MKAIRPVFVSPIDEPTQDIDMGAGQDEYTTLPVTSIHRTNDYVGHHVVSVSRWRLTDDERKAIFHGEADIVHQVIHTIGTYPPMNLQVVDADQNPEIVR